MDIWNLNNYIKDLKFLQSLITKYKIDGKFDVIETVINTLGTKAFVDYKLDDLEFWIDRSMKGTLPKDETFSFIVVKCDSQVCLVDPIVINHDSLHIFSLDLKITLNPSKNNQDHAKQRFSSWHLDMERNPEKCRLTHPYYHFQFGGKKLEYLEEGMGLLRSPRIPHPPMDIILLFHFVINNFYDNIIFTFVNELLNDPDYNRILNNSKKRIWDDYFKSFEDDNNHMHYTSKRIFPLYSN